MALAFPKYETDQLISMIGSKRPIAEQLRILLSSLVPKRGNAVFVDPFCGSGTVSRMALSMGMEVFASDLEPFSYIMNRVYLGLGSDDLLPMFVEMGGIDAYLSLLNLQGLYAAKTGGGLSRAFLSRHYAPVDDNSYDGDRERLFFTGANARFLDAVREEIEESWIHRKISATEKAVILVSILYEASRKANTSGSFTAYHKRFSSPGGGGRARIFDSCMLRAPVLPDADLPKGEMHLCEASEFVKRYRADICFLDPPATVHQYGSTYHLLNSITVWDDFLPSDARDQAGNLLDKAGIRTDWKRTHSPYCSLKHADAAFIHLFANIDARHIVVTYPSSGIVDANRIHELLRARHDPVTVIPVAKRNQGGRQGSGGKRNIEQVFITGKPASLHLPVGEGLDRLPWMERLDALTSVVFKEPQHVEPFRFIGGVVLDRLPQADILLGQSLHLLQEQVETLEAAVCSTVEETLQVLVSVCMAPLPIVDGVARAKLEKRLFSLLRSLRENRGKEGFRSIGSFVADLAKNLEHSTSVARKVGERLDCFLAIAYDES